MLISSRERTQWCTTRRVLHNNYMDNSILRILDFFLVWIETLCGPNSSSFLGFWNSILLSPASIGLHVISTIFDFISFDVIWISWIQLKWCVGVFSKVLCLEVINKKKPFMCRSNWLYKDGATLFISIQIYLSQPQQASDFFFLCY